MNERSSKLFPMCLVLIILTLAGCSENVKKMEPPQKLPNQKGGKMPPGPVPGFQPPDLSALQAQLKVEEPKLATRVEQLFSRMAAGTFAETYETETTPEFRSVTPLDKYKKLGDRVRERLGALKDKSIMGVNIVPQGGDLYANIQYKATFEQDKGTVMALFKKVDGSWKVQQIRINAPKMLDDPSKFRERIEIYVENAQPVMPGTRVDLVDGEKPPNVLVGNAQVLNVRWKSAGPFDKPKFPAKGFVTFALTNAEKSAIKGVEGISIVPVGPVTNLKKTD